LAELVGIETVAGQYAQPVKMHTAFLSDPSSPYIDDVPYRFSFLWQRCQVRPTADAKGIYTIDGSSPLVVQNHGGRKTLFWDPAVLEVLPEPKYETKPLIEWIKSAHPYFLAARIMHDFLRDSDCPTVRNVSEDSPIAISAWQLRDGSYRVLAGNLEEGLRVPHDRDLSVHVRIDLPKRWLGNQSKLKYTEMWHGASAGEVRDSFRIDLEQAETAFFEFSR
jgi:hypothetical protein